MQEKFRNGCQIHRKEPNMPASRWRRWIKNLKYMKIGLKCPKITSLRKQNWKAKKCVTAFQAWVGKRNSTNSAQSCCQERTKDPPSVLISMPLMSSSSSSSSSSQTYASPSRFVSKNRQNEQSNMPNPNRSTRRVVSNSHVPPPRDVLSGGGGGL